MRGAASKEGDGAETLAGEEEITMELKKQDLDDLIMAVERWWLKEYGADCPDSDRERMRMLLIRLKVRRLTTTAHENLKG